MVPSEPTVAFSAAVGGSGDFAASRTLSVTEQIEAGKQQSAKKYTGSSYIAYFQAYTNTYASLEYLETLYMEAITHPDTGFFP